MNKLDIIFKAFELMESEGYTLDYIQNSLTNYRDARVEERLKDSTTNSPIGCQHWYNTLLGQIAQDAEYLKDKPTVGDLAPYAEGIAKNARILLDNYDKIPFNY